MCRSFRPEIADRIPAEKLVQVELGKRAVWLCATHAYIYRWSGVTTFEGLRKLFVESDGRRSFVPRRVSSGERRENDRRAHGVGRRATDVEHA